MSDRPRMETVLGLPIQPFQWTTGLMTITPAIAQELLKRNERNRDIDPINQNALVKEVQEGRFIPTYEVIPLDRDDRLIDGQKRCGAVVETQKPIQAQITFMCDPASVAVAGAAQVRRSGVRFALEGGIPLKHAPLFEGASRVITAWEAGKVPWNPGKEARMTVHQIRSAAMAHPVLVDVVAQFMADPTARVPHRSATVAFLTLFHETDRPDKAAVFQEGLMTGAGLGKGSPILAFKNSTSIKSSYPLRDYMLRMVRAWNRLYLDHKINEVSAEWNRDSTFPEIKGYPT